MRCISRRASPSSAVARCMLRPLSQLTTSCGCQTWWSTNRSCVACSIQVIGHAVAGGFVQPDDGLHAFGLRYELRRPISGCGRPSGCSTGGVRASSLAEQVGHGVDVATRPVRMHHPQDLQLGASRRVERLVCGVVPTSSVSPPMGAMTPAYSIVTLSGTRGAVVGRPSSSEHDPPAVTTPVGVIGRDDRHHRHIRRPPVLEQLFLWIAEHAGQFEQLRRRQPAGVHDQHRVLGGTGRAARRQDAERWAWRPRCRSGASGQG